MIAGCVPRQTKQQHCHYEATGRQVTKATCESEVLGCQTNSCWTRELKVSSCCPQIALAVSLIIVRVCLRWGNEGHVIGFSSYD